MARKHIAVIPQFGTRQVPGFRWDAVVL